MRPRTYFLMFSSGAAADFFSGDPGAAGAAGAGVASGAGVGEELGASAQETLASAAEIKTAAKRNVGQLNFIFELRVEWELHLRGFPRATVPQEVHCRKLWPPRHAGARTRTIPVIH